MLVNKKKFICRYKTNEESQTIYSQFILRSRKGQTHKPLQGKTKKK